MTDVGNFFHELVRNGTIKYDNITKIGTGQRDDSATGCLLAYPCFSKQQALDADPKAKKQIKFIGNLNRVEV